MVIDLEIPEIEVLSSSEEAIKLQNAGTTIMGVSNEVRKSEEFSGVDWDSVSSLNIGDGIILSYRRTKKIHACVVTIDKDLGLRIIGKEVVI